MSNHSVSIDPVASRLGAKLCKLALAVGEMHPDLASLEGAIDRLLLGQVKTAPKVVGGVTHHAPTDNKPGVHRDQSSPLTPWAGQRR